MKTFKQSALDAHLVSQRTFSLDCLPISSLTSAFCLSCSWKTRNCFAENLNASDTSCVVTIIFLMSGSFEEWTMHRFSTWARQWIYAAFGFCRWIRACTPLICPLMTPALSYPWALIWSRGRPRLFRASKNFVVSASAFVPLSASTNDRNSSRMMCLPLFPFCTKRTQTEICSFTESSVD